jgi:hypothetical protein
MIKPQLWPPTDQRDFLRVKNIHAIDFLGIWLPIPHFRADWSQFKHH